MAFVTVKSAEGPDTPYQISQELLDARPDDFTVIDDAGPAQPDVDAEAAEPVASESDPS